MSTPHFKTWNYITSSQGVASGITTQTTTYACDSRTNADGTVIPDATVFCNFGATHSVTLPSPALIAGHGRIVRIVDISGTAAANNVTILPFAGETVQGGSSLVIATNLGGVVLQSDGTNWHRIASA